MCYKNKKKIVDIVPKVTVCGKTVPDGEEVRLCSPVRTRELAAAISIFRAHKSLPFGTSSLPTKLLECVCNTHTHTYAALLSYRVYLKFQTWGFSRKKKIQSI